MGLKFLAADFPPQVGGIQTYVHGLCKALAARGEELTVIATRQPESEAFDANCPYPVVRVAGHDLTSTVLAMNQALAAHAGAPEAIIATKWSPEGVAALLVRKRLACPYLVMGYGREFVQTAANVMKWGVQRMVLRHAAGGLAISNYTAGLMPRRGLPRDRVKVIHAGVDPAEYAEPPQLQPLRDKLGLAGAKVILTVSRLVARKGQEQVIRALETVRERIPQVRYVIAGEGPRREELERLAGSSAAGDAVIFTGDVSPAELVALYHLCDVFVMTSRDVPDEPIEGFGLVYLEANACGKPVIGGRTGGVPDAVEHEVNGLLVDPERPDEIAGALLRLLAEPELAMRLGEQGRKRVLERFTWDHVATRFQQALVELGVRAPTNGGVS